jgi:hypothetical protein
LTIPYFRFNSLNPEVTFQNIVTKSAGTGGKFYQSWIAQAAKDSLAKHLFNRFQHRPAEELCDVVNAPFEMNNIAIDSRLASVKQDLKERLLKWMEQQGDKGQ